jgi:hypothetical protein
MTALSATASTVDSSAETPAARLVAIHQPNLLPRLSTLAKLFAADEWIVLDEVQFVRRDYQHRVRLASPSRPDDEHLLTLPVHLSDGRSTRICDVRLAEAERSARCLDLLSRQMYRRSEHWADLEAPMLGVLRELRDSDDLSAVSTASTVYLLRALGWQGMITRTQEIVARTGRTERLVDLTLARSGTHYLCGIGGLRYIDRQTFDEHGIQVIPCRTPTGPEPLWAGARRLSALWALATYGREYVRATLERHRAALPTNTAAVSSLAAW